MSHTRNNPILVALNKRHATTTTTMRDRRGRRPKDARHRDWEHEAPIGSRAPNFSTNRNRNQEDV